MNEKKDLSSQTDSAEYSDGGEHQSADNEAASKQVDNVVDHIEKLPPKQQQMAMAKLEMYSGPIPHPDILEKYEKLYPGAAKSIIDNGVTESSHRRELEDKTIEYTRRDRKRRDWMGFIIGLVIIVVGALLIYLGHVVTGTILSGASALGLVGLFVDNGNESSGKSQNDDKK